MASRASNVIRNVVLNSDDIDSIRDDGLSSDQWMTGVDSALSALLVPPCQTSRLILDMVVSSGKTVTIIPEKRPMQPDRSDANASANATNPPDAARVGGTSEDHKPGTGLGSDVIMTFTAQDSAEPSAAAPLNVSDEAILHEMVHAMRQTWGMEDTVDLHAPGWAPYMRKGDLAPNERMEASLGLRPIPKAGKYSQIYHEYEEFIAVLITNIYRSENNRPGLMRDHSGFFELAYPLTNAKNFLTVWRSWIERLVGELPALVVDQLASVEAHFNPIWELYLANGWSLAKSGSAGPYFGKQA